jgi:hypothetical protein
MGAEPSVGVATGIAFCGVVGHPGGRREYTVLGDIVNLSARLMQRATEKQEGVLTDSETYYQAQEHLEFNYLKQVLVKGKAKKVDVWQPHQRGFKTKRTLLGKALGVKKHRRRCVVPPRPRSHARAHLPGNRRSLDSDWKDQVNHFAGALHGCSDLRRERGLTDDRRGCAEQTSPGERSWAPRRPRCSRSAWR